jgi:hypothetical protein
VKREVSWMPHAPVETKKGIKKINKHEDDDYGELQFLILIIFAKILRIIFRALNFKFVIP